MVCREIIHAAPVTLTLTTSLSRRGATVTITGVSPRINGVVIYTQRVVWAENRQVMFAATAKECERFFCC